jgi:hypothetical protein
MNLDKKKCSLVAGLVKILTELKLNSLGSMMAISTNLGYNDDKFE